MNDSTNETRSFKRSEKKIIRSNWLFEVEPYSRTHGESLSDLRDNLRLRKVLRHAVEKDFAPTYLIERIRSEIRA